MYCYGRLRPADTDMLSSVSLKIPCHGVCQDRHHHLVIVVLLVIVVAQVQVRVIPSLSCGTGAGRGTERVVAMVDVVMLAHHRGVWSIVPLIGNGWLQSQCIS